MTTENKRSCSACGGTGKKVIRIDNQQKPRIIDCRQCKGKNPRIN